MRRGAAVVAAALVMLSAPAGAELPDRRATMLDFAELRGWDDDDHGAALEVFASTCGDLTDREWSGVCALARQTAPEDARGFFEALFRPVLIEDGVPAMFTGYFEPELDGALRRTDIHRWPLYRLPPEVEPGIPFLTRTEIETTGALAGRGLEIVWVDDPVEAFFLQVQGSGRVRLPSGRVIRVGYGGKNGHEYRSVGLEMIRRGLMTEDGASAERIRDWVRENPAAGAELLRHNPSFVFFREVSEVPAERGPLGAMNRSITPLRSVAVDPAFQPLGAPVWIESEGRAPMQRLMVAQDTGSAIVGAQRADIFFGTGEAAGRAAGAVRDGGRMVTLLPNRMAYAMAPDDLL